MVVVEDKQAHFWRYKLAAVCAGGLASVLTVWLCVLRRWRGKAQLHESPNDKEEVPVVVIREGPAAKGMTVEASELSSLYEDVVSQNFIDVLFVKSPPEGSKIYPINLTSSSQKENLLEQTSDEIEPSVVSGGKDDLTDPGGKDEITEVNTDHSYNISASNMTGNDTENLKEIKKELAQEEGSVLNSELDEFITTKMFNLIEEEKKESFEKIEAIQTGIDERLNNIEDKTNECYMRVDDIERTTRKWYQRLDFIEAELADLHEKMYTLLTKLEEKPKKNCIVLSSMAKEAAMLEQDALNGIFDVETTIAKYITQSSKNIDEEPVSEWDLPVLQEHLKSHPEINEQDLVRNETELTISLVKEQTLKENNINSLMIQEDMLKECKEKKKRKSKPKCRWTTKE